MRKDEYTLTQELRRLEKYGFLLQAKRVGYVENDGYKYNILFTEDKSVLEPECSLSEVLGIINSLDTCLQILLDQLDQAKTKAPSEENNQKSKSNGKIELTKDGKILFEELRKLRTEYAKAEGVSPFIVFNNRTLEDMCIKMPSDKQEMLNVSGVGESKFAKYGYAFLDKIAEYKENNPDAETSYWNEVENESTMTPERDSGYNDRSTVEKKTYADWVDEYLDTVIIRKEGYYYTVRGESAEIIGELTNYRLSKTTVPMTGSTNPEKMINVLKSNSVNYVLIEDNEVVQSEEFPENRYYIVLGKRDI